MLTLADLFIVLLFASAAAWLWRGHGIRERALALVRRHCEKMDVLLLDDNVALRRLSLLRDAHGRRADQHQPHVKDGVAIDLQQGSDPLITLCHDDGQGEERQVQASDGDDEGGVVTAPPGDGQHQGHHGPRGQQQGQERQQLRSGEGHCSAPVVCKKGNRVGR